VNLCFLPNTNPLRSVQIYHSKDAPEINLLRVLACPPPPLWEFAPPRMPRKKPRAITHVPSSHRRIFRTADAHHPSKAASTVPNLRRVSKNNTALSVTEMRRSFRPACHRRTHGRFTAAECSLSDHRWRANFLRAQIHQRRPHQPGIVAGQFGAGLDISRRSRGLAVPGFRGKAGQFSSKKHPRPSIASSSAANGSDKSHRGFPDEIKHPPTIQHRHAQRRLVGAA